MLQPYLGQSHLRPYALRRWCCPRHGYFETRTTLSARPAANCPVCSTVAEFIEECSGVTSKALPYVSQPRLDLDPELAKFQITNTKGVTGRARLNPKSIRSGKSTGRPRKTPREPFVDTAQDEAARRERLEWLDEREEPAQQININAKNVLKEMERGHKTPATRK
jgi:hypothetical protein